MDLGQELPQHGPGIMHDQFICSSGQFLFPLVFSLGNPVTMAMVCQTTASEETQ